MREITIEVVRSRQRRPEWGAWLDALIAASLRRQGDFIVLDGDDPKVIELLGRRPGAATGCGHRVGARGGPPSRGLGDTLAKVFSRFGVRPCGGCKKRQEKLNRLVPYRKKG